MQSIDVRFHVVPLPFVEAVRADTFHEAVQIERGNGRERVVYHVPPGVAVEPNATFTADLYDLLPFYEVFMHDIAISRPLARTPHFAELQAALARMVERVVLNNADPKQALAQAAGEFERTAKG